jgi:hypothetical protein
MLVEVVSVVLDGDVDDVVDEVIVDGMPEALGELAETEIGDAVDVLIPDVTRIKNAES